MLQLKDLKEIASCEGKECESCGCFRTNSSPICMDQVEIAKTAIEAIEKLERVIKEVGYCNACKNKEVSTSEYPCNSCKGTGSRFELKENLERG